MRRRGFTLVEAVVSFALLAILISSSVYLVKNAMGTRQLTGELCAAMDLAQTAMEELRSRPFESVGGSSFAGGNGNISVRSITSDLKEIKLTLYWNAKHPPIELYTMRSR
ncbi:MAG TPA: type II secretion system protein [Candidatus Omnitrophota bacterium]|nr:type II secretion system protein [Candidatus Omnitrophota bacterium]